MNSQLPNPDYHLDVHLESEYPYIGVPLFRVDFTFYDGAAHARKKEGSFYLFASNIVEAAFLAYDLSVYEGIGHTRGAKMPVGVRVTGILRMDDSVNVSPVALAAFPNVAK